MQGCLERCSYIFLLGSYHSVNCNLGKSELVALVLSVIDWQGSDLLVLGQGYRFQIVDRYLNEDNRACPALGILVFMHSFLLRVRLPRT